MKLFMLKTSITIGLVLTIGCSSVDDKKDGTNNGSSNETNNNTSNKTDNSTNLTTNNGTTGECFFDTDCRLGTVCSAAKTCILAACEFCTVDQICYKPTPESSGSCSASE